MHIDNNLSALLLREQENLSRQSKYASQQPVLITPAPSAEETQDLEKELQALEAPKRLAPQDIVSFNGIEIDLEEKSSIPKPDYNIRALSPRDMVDVSMDLYIDGNLSYEEYSMLAFQPELHPNFEESIGALTGERADPDRPRDFIAQWEEHHAFEQRYPSDDPKKLRQMERILAVLNSVDQNLDFVA